MTSDDRVKLAEAFRGYYQSKAERAGRCLDSILAVLLDKRFEQPLSSRELVIVDSLIHYLGGSAADATSVEEREP